jgi:hypothetical protein
MRSRETSRGDVILGWLQEGAQAKTTSSDPVCGYTAATQTMESMAVWKFDREHDNSDMLNIVILKFTF